MLPRYAVLLMIYLGTVFYTLASYYHLAFKNWSFGKAFLFAMPLVAIEYCFSLNGNRYASDILNLSAVSILLITMCFYFVNTSILNYFIIKKPSNVKKEIIAFILILMAFFLSLNNHQ